jgi:LysR family cyn operon transcriptional activator
MRVTPNLNDQAGTPANIEQIYTNIPRARAATIMRMRWLRLMHLSNRIDAIIGRYPMNLRALRMFVTTAECGSLSRACAQLNLSQPAASRQIHALEAEFGVSLFHRVGRQLQLTSAGESLMRQSRSLLADADVLSKQASALKEGRKGTLRVSATPQLMSALLTAFLPGHRHRHPGIEVQLVERNVSAQQRNQLETGEIDLSIMAATDARFPGRLLFPIHTLAVMPKTHRLARRAVVDVAEIAKEPLLLLRGFGARASFDAACEIAQVIPRVYLECTVAHALVGLAAAGYGIAIVPSIATIQDRKLCAVPLVLRGVSIGHWEAVCWDQRREAPSYVEPFVNELVAHSGNACPGRKLLRRAPSLPKPAGPFR